MLTAVVNIVTNPVLCAAASSNKLPAPSCQVDSY